MQHFKQNEALVLILSTDNDKRQMKFKSGKSFQKALKCFRRLWEKILYYSPQEQSNPTEASKYETLEFYPARLKL